MREISEIKQGEAGRGSRRTRRKIELRGGGAGGHVCTAVSVLQRETESEIAAGMRKIMTLTLPTTSFILA